MDDEADRKYSDSIHCLQLIGILITKHVIQLNT